MRLTRLLPVFLLATGCARTVPIEVPAHPSVALDISRVAVVADARHCREVADALVAELNSMGRIVVDPKASVRLHVAECGHSMQTAVDVELDDTTERRRVTVVGRAHAVVAVELEGAIASHLIASGRHLDHGGWGELDVLGRQRAMDRALSESVAIDLAVQIDPMPRIAERRVYPRAIDGSPRQLQSQAVAAELSGDLHEAYRLARRAHTERPTDRTAAYVAELERLLVHFEDVP